jgi:hypothetical protein
MATKFCAVMPDSCVSSARNVPHVSFLETRFLENLYTSELLHKFNFGPYRPTYIEAEIVFVHFFSKWLHTQKNWHIVKHETINDSDTVPTRKHCLDINIYYETKQRQLHCDNKPMSWNHELFLYVHLPEDSEKARSRNVTHYSKQRNTSKENSPIKIHIIVIYIFHSHVSQYLTKFKKTVALCNKWPPQSVISTKSHRMFL